MKVATRVDLKSSHPKEKIVTMLVMNVNKTYCGGHLKIHTRCRRRCREWT